MLCDVPVKYTHCTVCGRSREVAGRLAKGGRCLTCRLRAAVESAQQMVDKSGPYYDRWARSNAMKPGERYPRSAA